MISELTDELEKTFGDIENDIERAQELGNKIRSMKTQVAKAEVKHAERLKAATDRLALMLATDSAKPEGWADAIKDHPEGAGDEK